MPKGLAFPIAVNHTGGFAIVDGAENDHKIIGIALGDGSNMNPFLQGVTLGDQGIFAVQTTAEQGRIVASIREIFADFERQRRYKLIEGSFRFIDSNSPEFDGDPGDMLLKFEFLNIERNRRGTYEHRVSSLRGK